jgi:UDP-N-acetylglucosamine 2-epimerase (non-hydrolysing)
MPLRIASIVGARPNFIKVAPIYKALKGYAEHEIIHTGQHYDFGLSKIFFKEFDLPDPDFNLEVGSGLPGYQIGEMTKKLEHVLLNHSDPDQTKKGTLGSKNRNKHARVEKSKPKYDLVLVYGDTNSTLAGALSAFKTGIKVGHIESGLRSFDRRMPEEINRILTDQLSEYHFASTKTAMANLKKEHVYGKNKFTGDLSVEVVGEASKISIRKSKVLRKLGLDPKSFILFTMHREENTTSAKILASIIESFELISKKSDSGKGQSINRFIVYPIHPGTKKKFKESGLYERLEKCPNLILMDPVGYIDFIQLIHNASKVMTDSGGVQKEAYILGVPCITIRENTEWIETVEEGWNRLVSVNPSKIAEYALKWKPTIHSKSRINSDNSYSTSEYNSGKLKQIFGTGNTSSLIREFIISLYK